MAKNGAAIAKAKEVKEAAKKVATTKVAPYKHKSTGQDVTHAAAGEEGVDSTPRGVVHSGSDHQPAHQENPMSKSQTKRATAQTETTNTEATTGATDVGRGVSVDSTAGADKVETKQDKDAAAAKAKIAEKEVKQAEAAKKKAEREAATAAKKEEAAKTKAEREAKAAENKAAREARAAELEAAGRKYTGSMLALSDRVKAGVYVKSTTGQLRSTDAVAEAFDAVPPQNVVKLGTLLFNEPNKYAALNIGQQSMNYRNRLRGAIRAGAEVNGVKITLDLIKEKIAELGLDTGRAEAEAKAKARAEREEKAAKAKAEKEEAKKKAEEAAAAKKAEAEAAAKAAGQQKAAEASQAQAAI